MASTGEPWRLGRRRYFIALYVVVWLLVLAYTAVVWGAFIADDVRIATRAGHALLTGDLRVYSHMPEAQMGPLALLLAGALPRWLFIAVSAALLPVVLRLIVAPMVRDRTTAIAASVGALLAVAPWASTGVTGHIDDPLVFVGAAGMIAALRSDDRRWVACACFALAIAGKPTAIVLLPLLFIRSWRLGLAGLTFGGLVWLPFVAADPRGFLHAGSGIAWVWTGSVPWLLGADALSPFPWWVRPAQLVGGAAVCWLLARRGNLASAVVAALTWRALLEPGTAPAYSVPLVLFALAVDVERGRLRLPLTLLALGSFVGAHAYHYGYLEALTRTPFLVAVFVMCVAELRPTPELSSTSRQPAGARPAETVAAGRSA